MSHSFFDEKNHLMNSVLLFLILRPVCHFKIRLQLQSLEEYLLDLIANLHTLFFPCNELYLKLNLESTQ